MTIRSSPVLRLAVALLALCAMAPVSDATAAPRRDPLAPIDYMKVGGLSAPDYPDIITDPYTLTMKDGTKIYVEVTRPAAPGRWPVIAEISPYHGTIYQRDGVRILPEELGGGLIDYFAPRGYAIVMADVRGTGRSGGCLDLMGPSDRSDAKAVIEWAAKQKWSNGRVGQLGHSYPGGTSVMALSTHAKGLETVVVSAGLGSMYEHQFQAGVPFNLQWAGPYIGYSALTFERHLPIGLPVLGSGTGGDDLGNNTEYAACGLDTAPAIDGIEQLTPADQLSGRWSPWHGERDFRGGAASAKVPVFVAHGVNDQAARIASLDWFLRRRNPGDKLWIGQWDHGIGCCPTQRGWQWTKALHAWFDKQLKQRDVDTGPPVEAFVNDAMTFEGAIEDQGAIYTSASFPPKAARMAKLYPDAGGGMAAKPVAPGSASFNGDPLGYFANELTNGVAFSTARARKDQLFVGVPRLRLAASVTVPRVHLIATLYDEDGDGTRRRITQFAINPELRESVKKAKVVVPGKKYLMGPPGWSMAHRLRTGHRLVLRVTTSDDDKVPFFAVDPNVTIYTGTDDTMLELPLVSKPKMYEDSFPLKRQSDTSATAS